MATKAQIHANQLNAQKSTGPSTPDGKAVVSQNALKHGLSAHQHVIIAEEQADFDLHRDKMLVELNPIGPMESMLADRIICLSWRLKRAVSIQNQAIDVMLEPPPPNPLAKLADSLAFKMAHLPQPDPNPPDPALALGRAVVKDLSNARVIERLLMYERRIEHSLFKTITELQRLNLTREFNPAVNPLLNIFRHSQSPRYKESPAPPAQNCDCPETSNPPQTQNVGCPVHTISSELAAQRRAGTSFQNPVSALPVTSANPAAFNPEQTLALRNRCGAKGAILQNKPNLGKVQMNPNPCLKMTYEEKCSPDDPKNKPNSNPIFELVPQPSADHESRATGHEPRFYKTNPIFKLGPQPIAHPVSRATSHGSRPKAKDGHEMGRGFRYR